jgi:DNA-binding CsgD family transcriptional regulator
MPNKLPLKRLQNYEDGLKKVELLVMCIERDLSPELTFAICGIPESGHRYYLAKYGQNFQSSKKTKKILEKNERQRVIEEMYKEGKTPKEISVVLKCDRNVVYRFLKRLKCGRYKN